MKPALTALLVLISACGPSSTSTAAHNATTASPTQSSVTASPTTEPSAGRLVVMFGGSPSQQGQTVSLVDRDGKVIASTTTPAADVEMVPFPGIIGRMGAALPTVSTSRRRVYFLSGLTELHYLGVDGTTGVATTLPNVKGRTQTVFAVSPDDKQIALAVFDWSQRPMQVTISVGDLGGGHRVEIFSSTSVYEWPVAWHAGLLVVAVGTVFAGGPNPYAAVSYHLVDSTNGLRRAALGSPDCQVVGPLVDAGTACNAVCNGGDVHNPPQGAQGCLDSVDWTGTQRELYRPAALGTWAALSPDGTAVLVPQEALVRSDGSRLTLPSVDTPVVWWVDQDTVSLYGTHLTGTNGAFYRLSTGRLIPIDDILGWIQGIVPGVS
ncbi:MAG TPA: hypothetical protein VNA65_03770 [Candidatus Dormibacteraeota bacterium]|nr:hypothetical protein [Candidatus Dormibacteraeota bacterium]